MDGCLIHVQVTTRCQLLTCHIRKRYNYGQCAETLPVGFNLNPTIGNRKVDQVFDRLTLPGQQFTSQAIRGQS